MRMSPIEWKRLGYFFPISNGKSITTMSLHKLYPYLPQSLICLYPAYLQMCLERFIYTVKLTYKLTLKAPRKKMHLKMSSAEAVCCKYLPNITEEFSIEANSVDPEQTAPIGAVWSGSTLFAIEAS